MLKEEQAPVSIIISSGVSFDNGFAAREFAELGGVVLKPGDIIQDVQ